MIKVIHLETVPPKGELVLLKPTANLSTGGTSTDVTDEVHPANIFMCERIAKIIGLDICGIDIMAWICVHLFQKMAAPYWK